MKTDWLQDDLKNIYLMNTYKIKHQPRNRNFITVEMQMKKLELEAEKRLSNNDYLDNQYLIIQKKEIIRIFCDIILKEYEKTNKLVVQKDDIKLKIKNNL